VQYYNNGVHDRPYRWMFKEENGVACLGPIERIISIQIACFCI